jgi:uncharacterized protein YbjT (DUF2867 family)
MVTTRIERKRGAISLRFLAAACLVVSVLPFQVPLNNKRSYSSSTSLFGAITSGDKVLVLGGTGGVGQLTIGKLQNIGDFKVCTATRNKMKAQEVIADDGVEIFQVDLLSEDTTALEAAMEGASALVISVGTTAFPTPKWNGGNTPKAIDELAVVRIVELATKINSMKKIVMVTSVGVERTGEMPFLILNLFGVLDAKKKGEEAVKNAARNGGFDYVVIRPGRLVGGPFTNLDIAKLLQVEGGKKMLFCPYFQI